MPGIPVIVVSQSVDFTGVTQLSFWYKISNTQNNQYTVIVYVGGVEIDRRNSFTDVPWTNYILPISYSGIKTLEVDFSGYDRTPHPALYLDDFEMMKSVWVPDTGGNPSISLHPGRSGVGSPTPGGVVPRGP